MTARITRLPLDVARRHGELYRRLDQIQRDVQIIRREIREREKAIRALLHEADSLRSKARELEVSGATSGGGR